MNSIEKDEIRALPYKYQPLSAWEYFGLGLLYSIPLIGFIVLIVHALSDENINRRSFARSYFCSILVIIIASIMLSGVITSLLMYLEYFLSQMYY